MDNKLDGSPEDSCSAIHDKHNGAGCENSYEALNKKPPDPAQRYQTAQRVGNARSQGKHAKIEPLSFQKFRRRMPEVVFEKNAALPDKTENQRGKKAGENDSGNAEKLSQNNVHGQITHSAEYIGPAHLPPQAIAGQIQEIGMLYHCNCKPCADQNHVGHRQEHISAHPQFHEWLI